jgi:hypothetical protein
MERMLGSIETKPHLKQFALITENCLDDQIIDLSYGTMIAYQLNILLVGKLQIPVRKDYMNSSSNTASLHFRYNRSHVNRYRFGFKEYHVAYFNRWLHLFMHEMLFQRLVMGKRIGATEKDIIWEFIKDYQMEDLIEYEAVKKSSYRIRKRKKNPVFDARDIDKGLSRIK